MSVLTVPHSRTKIADLIKTISPSHALGAALLALVIVGAIYAMEHRIGLEVADEGFLWYGAWRTSLGEYPIRDFDSYDPGRYYWAALWLRLFGNDIFVLRLSGAVIHAAALIVSLALLRRVTRNPWFLSAAAVVIACWLFPRHKPFEPAIAIFGSYAATLVVESASPRRLVWAGVFVGAAASVGRNHGVYLAAAFLALLAWLRAHHGARALARDVISLVAGIVMGYAPMLALLVFVPGFSHAFTETFFSFLRYPAQPPSLWSWSTLSTGGPLLDDVRLVTLGCLHVLAFAMYAYMGVCLIRDARSGTATPPVIVGTTFVGVVYLHNIFAWPDIRHFAQGVTPLLVGWAALAVAGRPSGRRRLAMVIASCFVLLTGTSVFLERPIVRYWLDSDAYRTAVVKGRSLIVQPRIAQAVAVTAEFASQILPGQSVLVVPNWPALYVLLDRPAPIRETYTLIPESAERQRQIIRELAQRNVQWVIVNDLTDNRRRSQYTFQSTHPLVWQHIRAYYTPQPLEGAPRNYLLFRAPPPARVADLTAAFMVRCRHAGTIMVASLEPCPTSTIREMGRASARARARRA